MPNEEMLRALEKNREALGLERREVKPGAALGSPIDANELRRMRACAPLLPPPGHEVVIGLLDEIERYRVEPMAIELVSLLAVEALSDSLDSTELDTLTMSRKDFNAGVVAAVTAAYDRLGGRAPQIEVRNQFREPVWGEPNDPDA